MAAVTSVSFTAVAQSPDRKFSTRSYSASTFDAFKLRTRNTTSENLSWFSLPSDVPTVSQTKANFLKAYKRPIPSIYNTVLQELIVQQHLMRYKRSYRLDAQKVEEWARAQSPNSLVDFTSREGEIEDILKDIAERAGSKGSFSYSRFFAVGLFRLLELANATEPTILDKLCAALNVNKKSVDRDLDVYRNLLSKLVQAKELLKEYVAREKKKIEERASSQKASEAVTKCLGEYQPASRKSIGSSVPADVKIEAPLSGKCSDSAIGRAP
ncbi:hypothetical protein DH2020_045649 [Rehmannia glutinosa]|uniref:Uncharacterized protein n=1 Tax=Rehmannia glutinosa TaxID=99300 RepID=A0ABR0UEA4_REHGL